MTQQEYEQKKRECWEEFTTISPLYKSFSFAFDRAYALGKKIGISDFSDAEEPLISGWVARDKGGFISLFSYRPDRVIHDDLGFWGHNDGSDEIDLPKSSFPDLTWESDPEPVEIILKRKKNG